MATAASEDTQDGDAQTGPSAAVIEAKEDLESAGHRDPEGLDYVASISEKKGLMTLHRIGWCYRVPGVHYRRFKLFGSEMPEEGCFDSYCGKCWPKAAGQASIPPPEEVSGEDGLSVGSDGTVSSSTSGESEEGEKGSSEEESKAARNEGLE